MKVDATIAIKEFLRTMDQFREAEQMIQTMTPEEQQALVQQQLLQSGALGKMATAPQGPPQGDMSSMGQMVAGEMGTI